MESKKHKNIGPFLAFTPDWFAKHQRGILAVANITRRVIPRLLFKSEELKDFEGHKITKIGTSFATADVGLRPFKRSSLLKTDFENIENTRAFRRKCFREWKKIKSGRQADKVQYCPAKKTVYFTDLNYSKMFYEAFKPLWWAMHAWDWLVADRLVPALSFGFSVLTQYPGSTDTNDPVDGDFRHYVDGVSTFATLVGGAGYAAGYTANTFTPFALFSSSTPDKYSYMYRGGACFDTSALGSGATVSTETPPVASLRGTYKVDDIGIAPNLNVYSFAPSATNSLTAMDYSAVGSTAFCDAAISYAAFSTSGYNDFTLNSSGIAAVSKTGITKFSFRNANYDVANSAPVWEGSKASVFYVQAANYGSNKPKLVVTYTVAPTQVSKTASLKYCVETTPSAPTKGLIYKIKTPPSATTKSLKYCVKKSPSATAAPTKSIKYCVRQSPSATAAPTKGLVYKVKNPSAAKTDSLKYTIKITPAAKTKGMRYEVKVTPASITKSLKYAIKRTVAAITKALAYRVKFQTVDITKSLGYKVKKLTDATKGLIYEVKTSPSFSLWSGRFKITPASVNPDLYFDLSLAPPSFWANVRSDGGDIRVTKEDGTTEVPLEVSGFDYAGHKGSLFIGTNSGTAFYIYYGNPSATMYAANATYGKYAVWESAAKTIDHLEDLTDSTVNQNTITNNGATIGAGKIGSGYDFDGSDDMSANMNGGLSRPMTVGFWYNCSAPGESRTILANTSYSSFLIYARFGIQMALFTTGGGEILFPGVFDGEWHNFIFTIDSSGHTLGYQDGSPVSALGGDITTPSITSIKIGQAFGAQYDGTLDEIRFFNRVLTPDEIATSYASQNDPAAFWTTGAAESVAYPSIKSVQYAVRPSITKTKSLKYTVKVPTSVQKQSRYDIYLGHVALTKGLNYRIRNQHVQTKGMQYCVKPTEVPGKGLKYSLKTQTKKTDSLDYRIRTVPAAMVKGLRYVVQLPGQLVEAVQYAIRGKISTSKGFGYALRHIRSSTAEIGYRVSSPKSNEQTLRYEVRIVKKISVGLGYKVINVHAKGLEVSLKYTVKATSSKMFGMRYVIRKYPYSGKIKPYLEKVSPYGAKNKPYRELGKVL